MEVTGTTEADAIRELAARRDRAERAKNLEATMAFFTDEPVLQVPGMPEVRGRDGVRAVLEDMCQLPMEDFEAEPTSIVVSSEADMAYELGRYRMPMPGPRGLGMERGKYTIIWRQLDGVWKYVVGCWNADEPPGS